MKGIYVLAAAAFATLAFGVVVAFSEGNSTRGQRVFGACAACHSLQSEENMTGPSLADLWNRKAGSVASFSRYSPALKSANIVWNDKTLDDWCLLTTGVVGSLVWLGTPVPGGRIIV
jgi:cytochrome c